MGSGKRLTHAGLLLDRGVSGSRHRD